ncbi:MAG: SbcC/MukB-like Walker B domain-containing protein [Desulfosporosinus sp.]|nr:SbcC/MukB-like Walker B domain-containing protein [Desulfosporosinus sp.]
MKLLNKVLLINWHYFVCQVIELKTLNFLTGKTGSGKSTIIDALQVLMLGDTIGAFFNKAANEQSRRSMKGYLLGEIAENEDEGTVYLRHGRNFSSYIVIEFYDTKEQKNFCLGVVFDNYADGGKEDHRYFYLGSELPDHTFLQAKIPMGIKALREWATQTVGKKNFTYFDSNAAYREEFRHLMGGLGEKFFSLFRKSVPFSPIMDIKGFIGDFVCNVANKVEIADMRENIRYYKQLEGELKLTKDRIASLAGIEKQFQTYFEEDKRLEMQRFLVDRSAQEKTGVDLDGAILRHKAGKNDLVELVHQQEEIEKQQKELEATYQETVAEKARCAEQQQKDFLEQGLKSDRDKLQTLQRNQDVLKSMIRQYTEACIELAQIYEKLVIHREKLQLQEVDELNEKFWSDFQSDFQAALGTARGEYHRLKDKEIQGKEQEQRLIGQIDRLKKGIKSYEQNLSDLVQAISAELSSSSRQVQPQVFADLLEIRDTKWRDAIEGYLHTQKFYLLVEPSDFVSALKVYDRLKFERHFYDLGLVDVEKLMKQVKSPMSGSLAEEVETDNPYARAYADYLLGRVIKVERVEDLRLHNTAITPTCMIYQNYVARQLNPKRYAVPYIGKKSIEAQIRIKENELGELQAELAHLKGQVVFYGRLNGIPDLRDDDRDRISLYILERADIDRVQFDIRKALDDLGSLDLSKVHYLEKKIIKLNEDVDKCKTNWQIIVTQQSVKQQELENLATERIPAFEMELRGHRLKIEEKYSDIWRKEQGEPRFHAELNRLGKAEKVLNNFLSQLARTEHQRIEKWNSLLSLRSDFNRDFRGSLDVTAARDEAWTAELQRLKDTSLPEYEDKIIEAKNKAQREFQEDFISKLRQNIELVREQINDLNKALKDVPFGHNRYRFRVTANSGYKEIYNMIMDEMLMEGFTLFSNEFQARYQPVVEQLFNQIVSTAELELSPEQKEELEKNLLKFTDYRTYLDFDLLEIDEEGRESRLSKTISKKSGGETQTPFYIAVLASFLQTYRVHQTNFNNTLRLLVFDEAYSKMDHQRIQESIKLLRDTGLQVIIAAPTEKIGDIAPFVDRNLCVTRVRQETVVKAFDPREFGS